MPSIISSTMRRTQPGMVDTRQETWPKRGHATEPPEARGHATEPPEERAAWWPPRLIARCSLGEAGQSLLLGLTHALADLVPDQEVHLEARHLDRPLVSTG
jgi:hypothetical protein